jgi:hypothetical protein
MNCGVHAQRASVTAESRNGTGTPYDQRVGPSSEWPQRRTTLPSLSFCSIAAIGQGEKP